MPARFPRFFFVRHRQCAVRLIATVLLVIASAGPVRAAAGPVPVSVETYALLALYTILIVLASLGGGLLPTMVRLTHLRTQMLISLTGGLMLGIGLFHLLPHSLSALATVGEGPDTAVVAMVTGILLMFLLLRAFHFHHHEPGDLGAEQPPLVGPAHDHVGGDPGHGDASHGLAPHEHDHHHHSASWVGVFFGLALHTLIDGMALGAAVESEALHQHVDSLSLAGFGTFLAIMLHKPLDAVSILSLMTTGGWSHRQKLAVNISFAAMCPLGAALFVTGLGFTDSRAWIVGVALAAASGVFICIALSDLLPEMEFHSHHRLRLTILLLAGIALAWGIRYLEPDHTHGPAGEEGGPPAAEMQPL